MAEPKSNVKAVDFTASKDDRIQKAPVGRWSTILLLMSVGRWAETVAAPCRPERGFRKEDRQTREKSKRAKSLHATLSPAIRGQRRAERLICSVTRGTTCNFVGRISYFLFFFNTNICLPGGDAGLCCPI